jgi:sec-independent protein translocase protein TatA
MGIIQFISGQEILVVFVIILLLFGSKRIPDFAKMMGKGMREFRKATDDIKREINSETNSIKDDVGEIKKSIKS